MLIGQAERLGGAGDVEQQRMRHDHEEDVDQMGASIHLSESDRYLSVLAATTYRGAGTFAKAIKGPSRDAITSEHGHPIALTECRLAGHST